MNILVLKESENSKESEKHNVDLNCEEEKQEEVAQQGKEEVDTHTAVEKADTAVEKQKGKEAVDIAGFRNDEEVSI